MTFKPLYKKKLILYLSGIQQAKNVSEQSLHPIIEEHTVSLLFMMLRMKTPSSM